MTARAHSNSAVRARRCTAIGKRKEADRPQNGLRPAGVQLLKMPSDIDDQSCLTVPPKRNENPLIVIRRYPGLLK